MTYLSRKAGNSEQMRRGAVVPVPFIDEADEYIMKALDALPIGHGVDLKGPGGKFEYLGKGQCS